MFLSRRRRTVHEWAVWSLVEDHLQSPTGEEFVRTYVDSPGAVGVVVVDVASFDDLAGRDPSLVATVLVSQYRAPFGEVMWEIPAGMRDVADEPAETTARRELAEEAGLEADHWRYLGVMASAPGITNSTVEIFVCCGLRNVDHERHGPEEDHMEVRRLPLADALDECRRGHITDSKTIVGLQWVAQWGTKST
ncbi:MAG: NUDIX hydrolase [Acidobacteria bacterium]|nr:NUDIX hydrolase [Acidobacteriota bacterium]